MADKTTGTVKWFNTSKGYGFITGPDGNDIFVHYSDIKADGFKNLTEGQQVTYIVKDGEKGPRATEVEPL